MSKRSLLISFLFEREKECLLTYDVLLYDIKLFKLFFQSKVFVDKRLLKLFTEYLCVYLYEGVDHTNIEVSFSSNYSDSKSQLFHMYCGYALIEFKHHFFPNNIIELSSLILMTKVL